jgi:hypothetical protein
VGGLPRQYEKLHAALEAEAAAASGYERERWARLRELGTTRSRLRREGASLPEALEREWAALREPAARAIAARSAKACVWRRPGGRRCAATWRRRWTRTG